MLGKQKTHLLDVGAEAGGQGNHSQDWYVSLHLFWVQMSKKLRPEESKRKHSFKVQKGEVVKMTSGHHYNELSWNPPEETLLKLTGKLFTVVLLKLD